ncbi:hypothetical protein BU16DRAFT_566807 [Lophium mytilinum]|uniref:Uncharacterized protein n=1 Tax=Lophium mytilinum TaxID=390894 RepID=A0A6A6QB57_9PEZI|nr:hypothetical protein BU16DRAFT_566807 [Lophium mytilinum]
MARPWYLHECLILPQPKWRTDESLFNDKQLEHPYDEIRDLVHCDELSLSVEERGYDYAGISPAALGVTRTFVQSWQNSSQGNCCKFLNDIQTNLVYFNDASQPNGDTNTANWQSWDGRNRGWNKKGGLPRGNALRDTLLTNQLLLRAKTPIADRSLSWYHKRNFTLCLKNNKLSGTSSFAETTFPTGTLFPGSAGSSATTVIGNTPWIICAVNLRGQDRYRWARRKSGNLAHNGYCWDDTTMKPVRKGVGRQVSVRHFSCDINFGDAQHVKRGQEAKPIGYFGGEPIYSVKRSGDYKTHVVKVDAEDAKLPDIRDTYPLSE